MRMRSRFVDGLVPLAFYFGALLATATSPVQGELVPHTTFTPDVSDAFDVLHELRARQAGSTTATMAVSSGDITGSDEEGTRAASGSLSLTVIIPLVVVAVLALAGGILWGCRYQIFKGRLGLAMRRADAGQLTAEELASGRRDRSASTTTSGTASGTGRVTNGGRTSQPADARRSVLNANGPRAQRARRGVRRTESGRSIRTLPEYSKEAGDEELVLVRQRSTLSISEADEEVDEDEVQVQLQEDERDQQDGQRESSVHRFGSIRSNASRQSIRSTRSTRSVARQQAVGDNGNEHDVPMDYATTNPTAPHSAPARDPSGGTQRRTLSDASRRGWGEAPTYLEAMSSPSFPAPTLEAGVPPPRIPSLRTRTENSFRGLLSRAGMTFAPASYRPAGRDMSQRHSSTSLLLQPQQSRMSTMTTPSRHSRDGRDGSTSPYTSPWASTLSLHISSPVPNSAVRASFDDTSFPRAGLSNEQMRFLSSQEAVNMVGVKLGDVPANKRRRQSVGTILGDEASPGRTPAIQEGEAPPPTWDEVQAQAVHESASRRDVSADATTERSSGIDVHADSIRDAPARPDTASHASQASHVSGQGGQSGQESAKATATGTDEAPAVEIEPPTPVQTSFGHITEDPLPASNPVGNVRDAGGTQMTQA